MFIVANLALIFTAGVLTTSAFYGVEDLKFKLCKENKYKSIDRVPEFQESEMGIIKAGIDSEVRSAIDEFIQFFDGSGLNMGELIEKINTAEIRKSGFPIFRKSLSKAFLGYYDASAKRVSIDKKDIRKTTLKALLDMVTRKDYDGFSVNGLQRTKYKFNKNGKKKYKYSIGIGLNEAYKEIMLNRYFGCEYDYPELVDLGLLIEGIVGQERMIEAFLTGDLGSVMESLEENGIDYKTIKRMDSIYVAGAPSLFFSKSIVHGKYNKALVQLSKAAVSKVKTDMSVEHDEEVEEKSKGLLGRVSDVLKRRSKWKIFNHTIGKRKLKKLEKESNEELSSLPEEYRLSLKK